jgi:hypothetical protein
MSRNFLSTLAMIFEGWTKLSQWCSCWDSERTLKVHLRRPTPIDGVWFGNFDGVFEGRQAVDFQSLRVDSPQLAALNQLTNLSPSFPHAFSGNPGEIQTCLRATHRQAGPPIKHLGVTPEEEVLSANSDTPQLAAG